MWVKAQGDERCRSEGALRQRHVRTRHNQWAAKDALVIEEIAAIAFTPCDHNAQSVKLLVFQ
jgi:hypothetical protein